MEQALTWIVTLLVIAGVFWALVRENNKLKSRTPEQYERDVANARNSLLRAGLVDLDRFVGEAKQKQAAVEYLKDEEQGTTKTGSKGDDAERTMGRSQ